MWCQHATTQMLNTCNLRGAFNNISFWGIRAIMAEKAEVLICLNSSVQLDAETFSSPRSPQTHDIIGGWMSQTSP